MSAPPIAVQGLTKRFGERVLAVDHVELTVEAGSVFGLLGPNGAGKTTTMRMLL
ncbi:MAG TPA: ATP-binding cassette domain-containing protein, partial [Acidimicrobiales bacterium]|nr:ATP-binding cassette domain-containing protein [Acidimicrobiales bacterium]